MPSRAQQRIETPSQANHGNAGGDNARSAADTVAALKDLWMNHTQVTESAMRSLYDDTVVFRDPANVITGIDCLVEHTLQLYGALESCHFNYIDEVVGEDRAAIRWVMTFVHPRLNGGKPVDVRGMTYIRWQGMKIVAHEDAFDVGAMFYENVPLLGRLISGLRKRLTASH